MLGRLYILYRNVTFANKCDFGHKKQLTMEVDPPCSSSIQNQNQVGPITHGFNSRDLESSMNGNGIPVPGTLKRSSSAPMINILVSTSSLEIR